MVKNCLGLLLLLYVVSCSNNNQQIFDTTSSANLQYSSVDNYIIDTSIFEAPEIVYLETTSTSLIKEVNKILVDGDDLFIIDKGTDKVFRFSTKGKFLNCLNNIGKGPREYRGIVDFDIDVVKKEIYVLCEFPYKIYIYSYDLEFLGEVAISSLYLELAVAEDKIYCRHAPFRNNVLNQFHIDVLDRKSGEIVGNLLPVSTRDDIDYKHVPLTSGNLLTNRNRKPMLSVPDRNYIYNLEGDISLKYTFEELNKDDVKGIYNWTDLDNYIFFKNNSTLNILHKSNKELIRYTYGIFATAAHCSLNRMVASNFGNGVVCVAYSGYLYNIKERILERAKQRGNFNNLNTDFLNLFGEIELDDNPILFFYKLT